MFSMSAHRLPTNSGSCAVACLEHVHGSVFAGNEQTLKNLSWLSRLSKLQSNFSHTQHVSGTLTIFENDTEDVARDFDTIHPEAQKSTTLSIPCKGSCVTTHQIALQCSVCRLHDTYTATPVTFESYFSSMSPLSSLSQRPRVSHTHGPQPILDPGCTPSPSWGQLRRVESTQVRVVHCTSCSTGQ